MEEDVITAIEIANGPFRAQLLNLGAVLRSLDVPGRDGKPADVTLGYRDLAEYQAHPRFYGAVAGRYAVAITPAMRALIDPADPADPIALQFVPDADELVHLPEERADPIGDAAHSPVEGIVHRYPDRVLLKAVHVCPVYCRFCFRREMVGPQGLGTLAPAALAARARAAGVELWALTDHDELRGQHEAREAALALGMDYLTGCEISVTFAGQTVHVIGLGFDPDDPALAAGLATTRGGRGERAKAMAEGLARVGIPGAYEGALALADAIHATLAATPPGIASHNQAIRSYTNH